MLNKFIDWLIKRRQKQLQIDINSRVIHESEKPFYRVLNTLSANKVMVVTFPDGIYIRLAGDESKGQLFSKEFARVVTFKEEKSC